MTVTEFLSRVAHVDTVMREYGLTTLSELDEAFGVARGEEQLHHIYEASSAQGTLKSVLWMLTTMERDLYKSAGVVFRAGGSVTELLCLNFAPDAYPLETRSSDAFQDRYPGCAEGYYSNMHSLQCLAHDYPEEINKEFVKRWVKSNKFYGWAVYEFLGMNYTEDDELASVFALNGQERTIMLPSAKILDDIWAVKLCNCRLVESDYDCCGGKTQCHIKRLHIKDDYDCRGEETQCHIERLLVKDEHGDVMDLVLVLNTPKRFHEWDYFKEGMNYAGVFSALLFVSRKNSNIPPVMHYRAFAVSIADFYDEIVSPVGSTLLRFCVDTCISDFVKEKTGLTFATFGEQTGAIRKSDYPYSVFPHISLGVTSVANTVKSQAFIERDVYAPSYVSFADDELHELTAQDRERLGIAVSFIEHRSIGFWKSSVEEFVTETGAYPERDKDFEASLDASLCGDVALLRFAEDAAKSLSDVEVQSCMGLAVTIATDDRPLETLKKGKITIYTVGEMSSCYGRHRYSRVQSEWEPTVAAPVALNDLSRVFVLLLLADDSAGDPEIFWVMSESGKWYEYSYLGAKAALEPDDIRGMKVFGLTDASRVLRATSGYVLAESDKWEQAYWVFSWGYTSNGMAKILGADKSLGINRVCEDRFVSMQNDMRLIWKRLSNKYTQGLNFQIL